MDDKLISKKKPFYKVSKYLNLYLNNFNRWKPFSISYDDLLRFKGSVNVYDSSENDTLWIRVYYNNLERDEIDENLKKVYKILHSDGNDSRLEHLNIDAIDYCTFGNSKPFRIKIRNILNDNFTYFYVKKTDASRIYGLELEHMLSPYNLNFLVNDSILIEEHISGIPGDIFITKFLNNCSDIEKSQIAKEFVKFNERCMIRLLGDMRAYNYVITPTHDFDQVVYKIRSIDFDQQCFEGKLNIYRPQFFEENKPMMNIVRERLSHDSVLQYKIEERSIVAKRIISSGDRINKLIDVMKKDTITKNENLNQLKKDIFKFTNEKDFLKCKNMGYLMGSSIDYVRKHYENHNLNNLIRSY